MADLPAARVSPSRPFENTGVDYAGPILARPAKGRGTRPIRPTSPLFVCMSTRAVHLELVSDYTTATFLAAFQRFVSRRGRPQRVYSDNGTNFRGAARDLGALAGPRCIFRSREHRVEFYSPPAPHFGGLWEADVKSAKHHLHRVVRDHTLSYEELATVLCMVEACLNSRPLVSAPGDDDDLALTPAHFVTGAPPLALPPLSSATGPASLRTRWELVQRMRDHFWRRWHADYLHSLQPRRKWASPERSLCVGDVVVLKGDDSPSAQWRLGRISRVHPGPDGRVRVVTVRTAQGESCGRSLASFFFRVPLRLLTKPRREQCLSDLRKQCNAHSGPPCSVTACHGGRTPCVGVCQGRPVLRAEAGGMLQPKSARQLIGGFKCACESV